MSGRKVVKTFGTLVWKLAEHSELSVSLEDKNVESNANNEDLVSELLQGNKDYQGCLCGMYFKNQ